MKYTLITTLALAGITFAAEESTPVKFGELPAPVAAAIKAAAGDAKFTDITKEKEDGIVAYAAAWKAKGRKHEVTVGEDGKVLGLEESIPLEEAPKAVRATIQKEADGREVIEVEKALEGGKTFFEAVIKTKKGTLEVKMDPSGKVVEREEESAEEKK